MYQEILIQKLLQQCFLLVKNEMMNMNQMISMIQILLKYEDLPDETGEFISYEVGALDEEELKQVLKERNEKKTTLVTSG